MAAAQFFLPDELWLKIFSFVEPQDLLQLLQVNTVCRKEALLILFSRDDAFSKHYARKILFANADGYVNTYNRKAIKTEDGHLELIKIMHNMQYSDRNLISDTLINNIKQAIQDDSYFYGRIFFNQLGFKLFTTKKITELINYLLIEAKQDLEYKSKLNVWYTLASLIFEITKEQIAAAYDILRDLESKGEMEFLVFARKLLFNSKYIEEVTKSKRIKSGLLDMAVRNYNFFKYDTAYNNYKEYNFFCEFIEFIPILTGKQLFELTKTVILKYRFFSEAYRYCLDGSIRHYRDKFMSELEKELVRLSPFYSDQLFELFESTLFKKVKIFLFLKNIYCKMNVSNKSKIIYNAINLLNSALYFQRSKLLDIIFLVLGTSSYKFKNIIDIVEYLIDGKMVQRDIDNISDYFKLLSDFNPLVKLKFRRIFNYYLNLLTRQDNSSAFGFNIVYFLNTNLGFSNQTKMHVVDLILAFLVNENIEPNVRRIAIYTTQHILQDAATPSFVVDKIIRFVMDNLEHEKTILLRGLIQVLNTENYIKELNTYINAVVKLFYANDKPKNSIIRRLIDIMLVVDNNKIDSTCNLSKLLEKTGPDGFFEHLIDKSFQGDPDMRFLVILFGAEPGNNFMTNIPFERKERYLEYYKNRLSKPHWPKYSLLHAQCLHEIINKSKFGISMFLRVFSQSVESWKFFDHETVRFLKRISYVCKFEIADPAFRIMGDWLYRLILKLNPTRHHKSSINDILEVYNNFTDIFKMYDNKRIKKVFSKILQFKDVEDIECYRIYELILKFKGYLSLFDEGVRYELIENIMNTIWGRGWIKPEEHSISLLTYLIFSENNSTNLLKIQAQILTCSLNGQSKLTPNFNRLVLGAAIEELIKEKEQAELKPMNKPN